jgi:hypothetical protein
LGVRHLTWTTADLDTVDFVTIADIDNGDQEPLVTFNLPLKENYA